MALDLKNILQTMKKDYSFVVKLALEKNISEYNDKMKCLETILTAKGMTNMSKPVASPLAAQPIVFQRLKGFIGTYYTINMTFEYPYAPSELLNEISTILALDRAFIVVRTEENPYNKIEDDYLKYNEEDYIPQLLTNEMPNDINENDFYGDEYNKELVKMLQSKEAKKYQHKWTEIKPKK